jgi:hypothetical protein
MTLLFQERPLDRHVREGFDSIPSYSPESRGASHTRHQYARLFHFVL